MITLFETYSNLLPEVGDYVYIKTIPKLIGKISQIVNDTLLTKYIIDYDEPYYENYETSHQYVAFQMEIEYFSKDKKEIEVKIVTDKYNL